ncbi:MAG: hypothetical protein NTY19_01270 [Planctomycetota bacterium]|nr:hypothetical protein [Planctomycetota bacterium]
MLLGELPELEETQSGKDLIRIGEERGEERGEKRSEKRGEKRGEQRGLARALLVSLRVRHGMVPAALQKQIRPLTADQAERLLEQLPQCQTLDEVAQWLSRQRP